MGILKFKAIDDFVNQSESNQDFKGLGLSEKSYVPNELGDVLDALAASLGPVAKSLAADRSFKGAWKAPGPWREWLVSPLHIGS